jgi:ABC-type uncharacterized transport system YnjBCD ATPase subunit
MSDILSFQNFILNESKQDKTLSRIHIKPGRMHKLLNIPENERIEDHFNDGKHLAMALVKALKGDQRKAAGMLAWVANIQKGHNIFDKALASLKEF